MLLNPGYSWSDDDYRALIWLGDRLHADPLDLLSVSMNESGSNPSAENPNGHAAGLWQAMPFILPGMGYHGSPDDFARLTVAQQIPYWFAYYRPYAGRLVNAAAVYCATFEPAYVRHARDPEFVMCGLPAAQRTDGKPGRVNPFLSDDRNALYYRSNIGFDPQPRKGWIQVSDLTAAIKRACAGAQWAQHVAKLSSFRPAGEQGTPQAGGGQPTS